MSVYINPNSASAARVRVRNAVQYEWMLRDDVSHA